MPDDEEASAEPPSYEPNRVTAICATLAYLSAAVIFALTLAHPNGLQAADRRDGTLAYPEPKWKGSEVASGIAFACEIAAVALCTLLAINFASQHTRLKSAANGPYQGDEGGMDKWHHAHPTVKCHGSPTLYWMLQFTLVVLLIGIVAASTGMLRNATAADGLYLAFGGCAALLVGIVLECCIYRRTDNGRHLGPRWRDDQRNKIWAARAFAYRRPAKASSPGETKEEEAAEEAEEAIKEEAEEEAAAEEASHPATSVVAGSVEHTALPPGPRNRFVYDAVHRCWLYFDHDGRPYYPTRNGWQPMRMPGDPLPAAIAAPASPPVSHVVSPPPNWPPPPPPPSVPLLDPHQFLAGASAQALHVPGAYPTTYDGWVRSQQAWARARAVADGQHYANIWAHAEPGGPHYAYVAKRAADGNIVHWHGVQHPGEAPLWQQAHPLWVPHNDMLAYFRAQYPARP